jgi:hypothetical protein
VLGRFIFKINFKGTPFWITKNVLPALESKLLFMSEIIGEALKMVYNTDQFAEIWC